MRTRWIILAACLPAAAASTVAYGGMFQNKPAPILVSHSRTRTYVSANLRGIRASSNTNVYASCWSSPGHARSVVLYPSGGMPGTTYPGYITELESPRTSCLIQDSYGTRYYCYGTEGALPPLTPSSTVRLTLDRATGQCTELVIESSSIFMEPVR